MCRRGSRHAHSTLHFVRQNRSEIRSKIRCEKRAETERKGGPKWSQNRSKINEKRGSNADVEIYQEKSKFRPPRGTSDLDSDRPLRGFSMFLEKSASRSRVRLRPREVMKMSSKIDENSSKKAARKTHRKKS